MYLGLKRRKEEENTGLERAVRLRRHSSKNHVQQGYIYSARIEIKIETVHF